jgi:hypothetical protein
MVLRHSHFAPHHLAQAAAKKADTPHKNRTDVVGKDRV